MGIKKIFVFMLLIPLVSGSLISCRDSSGGVKKSFQISVTNLSYGQPLSPLAIVMHKKSYQAWQVGETASMGLELLAEGGDNTEFLKDAYEHGVLHIASGEGVIVPGETASVDVELRVKRKLQLTIASMLVNTNDAYTGVSGLDLSRMKVGNELDMMLGVYDSGTETNSELAGTIPGPADGGEGYNSAHDDLGRVTRHPGVATRVANHPDSVLDQAHRFDSPVAMLRITRLE